MSVLDRSALEASPLADLHAIASELLIDGYRRLRRADLIAAIIQRQEGGEAAAPATAEEDGEITAPPRRSRAREADEPSSARPPRSPRFSRSSRSSGAKEAEGPVEVEEAEAAGEPAAAKEDEDGEPAGTRRRRGRRGGRGRAARDDHEATPATADGQEAHPAEAEAEPEPEPEPDEFLKAEEAAVEADAEESAGGESEDLLVEGVVELLANGSGFVRVDPPDPSDDDVYISSAQVKRCELVSGDRITGPKRAPRRSERFASLIRIETINGRPAAELADSVRFDDLPAAFPNERLKIGSEDPTLKAIEWLTPFGKGSRITIVGRSRAGKTEALRRLAAALSEHDELSVSVALAGVRPEEISEWAEGPAAPVAAVSFAASEEARNGAVEPVIDQARRLAARGADAVVLIDTLDGCSPQMARKALGSARNIVDGGSVTVIATALAPIGGETTVISLDVGLASTGRFPALDLTISGSMRPELLVGEAGADAIARTRAEAADEND
ncbi:MAG: Rho termination factor N-terminal domain-containing protein [Solirubrobacteraceae bacterium]